MKSLACLLEAFSWLTRPGLRKFIWGPLSINILVFTLGGWALLHYFGALMNHFLPADSWQYYLRWLLWPIIAIALVVVVFYTFSLLANIIAAPFNSFLAEAVERIESGRQPDPVAGNLWQEAWGSVIQEIRKAAFFIVRAIPIVILSFIPGLNFAAPFLWFVYSAWVAYLQYMDYPMANHGIAFSRQRQLLAGRPLDTFGFGALVTLMLTIPILNLIAMPVAVIGASLHWSRNIHPATL